MTRRQRTPEQWLIIAEAPSPAVWRALLQLRRGSGVLVLHQLNSGECRRLRRVAKSRGLTIVAESATGAARVHNMRELRRVLLSRTPLIFLSPIHETGSHPDWMPLPRMRAAALAALGGRKLIALGGMNARRYPKVAQLGFIGWAGISAFRT